MKISQQWMNEGKALVDSGDLNLSANRARYVSLTGKVSTLTDEQLMVACMAGEPDGEDDSGFIKAVEDIEANGFEVTADSDDSEGALVSDDDFNRSSHHSS